MKTSNFMFTLFVAGFTQQYRALNALIDSITSSEVNIPFSIAAFPCNQFGLQGLCVGLITRISANAFSSVVYFHILYLRVKHDVKKIGSLFPSITYETILTVEPGENYTEIVNGLMYVRPGNGYIPHDDIDFFNKQEVNGPNEHPMFSFLKVMPLPNK